MNYKPRRSLIWFIKNVGKELVKNNKFDLFEKTLKVESEQHAKALHADQDKGNRYHLFNM
jgi:hypothetical protein